MPDRLDKTKDLQKFLGILNYARNFIKDLGKIAGPLYSKTGSKGQKSFNTEDTKIVKLLKQRIQNIPDLSMPLEKDYLIIETDGSFEGWGAVLKAKTNKYSSKTTERICAYQSGKYKEKGNMSSIDASELMNKTLICNENKKFSSLRLLTKIRLQNYEITTLALVDTGCTSSIINKKIVPESLIKTLDKPSSAMQMDGTHNFYNYYLPGAVISFINSCNKFYSPNYKINRILVRDLNINTDFILGLDFLLYNNGKLK